MPATPTPMLQTPRQKAILGTAVVFVLLLLFAFVGYWYGKKGTVAPANTTTINTNITSTSASGDASAAQKTVIAGKITKVLASAIEITSGSGDNATTITATIVEGTLFRKLDLRTIPKNGVGDGTPMTFKELKVGNQVVVATADATSNAINASKVSLVIYP